jgi:hypothetical protein
MEHIKLSKDGYVVVVCGVRKQRRRFELSFARWLNILGYKPSHPHRFQESFAGSKAQPGAV